MVNQIVMLLMLLNVSIAVFAIEHEVKGQQHGHVVLHQQNRKKPKQGGLFYLSQYGTSKQVAAKLQSYPKYTPEELGLALHFAARYGNSKSVGVLLGAKADPRSRDMYGWTALHLAAKPSIVQSLVDAKGDPRQKDNVGRSPLSHAVERDDYGVVDYLLWLGVEVNAPDTGGWCPLHIAHNAVTAKKLLDAHADPNVAGGECNATPLHLACEQGDAETAKLLLKFKADPHAPSSLNTEILRTADGYATPLLLAARYCPRSNGDSEQQELRGKYIDIMKALVAAGALIESEKMYDECLLNHSITFYDIESMIQDEARPQNQVQPQGDDQAQLQRRNADDCVIL